MQSAVLSSSSSLRCVYPLLSSTHYVSMLQLSSRMATRHLNRRWWCHCYYCSWRHAEQGASPSRSALSEHWIFGHDPLAISRKALPSDSVRVGDYLVIDTYGRPAAVYSFSKIRRRGLTVSCSRTFISTIGYQTKQNKTKSYSWLWTRGLLQNSVVPIPIAKCLRERATKAIGLPSSILDNTNVKQNACDKPLGSNDIKNYW